MAVEALLFDFHDTLVHLPRPVSDEQWRRHSARRLAPLLRAWGAAGDGGVLADDLLARVRRAGAAAAATHASPDVAAVVRAASRQARRSAARAGAGWRFTGDGARSSATAPSRRQE